MPAQRRCGAGLEGRLDPGGLVTRADVLPSLARPVAWLVAALALASLAGWADRRLSRDRATMTV
ncbi:MAG: hypothetical protein HOP99_01370 [Dermatophilaceae bacterium]|nr:hypothetical protein [Dermatophilaceae bacterium]